MTQELQMVWQQLQEVYAALKVALAEIPDERLHWQPAPNAMAPSILAQHVARANLTYSHFMQFGERRPRKDYVENASRDAILERLDESLEEIRQAFEAMTPEALARPVANDWAPIGAEIPGPLTGLWFAYTMLTHSAYHVGQMNTISLLVSSSW